MIHRFMSVLRESSIAIWLLSFYVFIWFLQIGDRVSFLGTIRIEFIIGLTLIFLSIKQWLKNRSGSLGYHSGFIKSIYFLYFIFIIYTFASYDPDRSWYVFSERIIKFSMFTLFIGTLVTNKSELVLVIFGYFLAMLKIIEEGMWGVMGGGMMWENQGILRLHGVTGLYRHPNSLSGAAIGALPFFLFLYQFQTKLIKIVFAIGIIGLLSIVMYTGSRTGYVALFILLMAILLRVGIFRFKTIASILLVAFVVVSVVPQEYKDRFGTMTKSKEEMGGSANARLEIIDDALAIVTKYPLGLGIQAFPHVREMEFNRKQDTHNLYLEILTNLGPVGLIAFIIFVGYLFRVNIRSRNIFLESNEKFLAEFCYIINLYILCRLALGLFGMDLYEVYWWFAAGFTIALAKQACRLEVARFSSSRLETDDHLVGKSNH